MASWIVFILFILFCVDAYRRATRPISIQPVDPRQATLSEIAWLAGGDSRLADVWWAQLHQFGYLQADEPFDEIRVRPTAPIAGLDGDAYTASVGLSAQTVWSKSEIMQVWKLVAAATVARKCQAAGWAYDAEARRRAKTWHSAPVVVLVVVGMFSLFMLSTPVPMMVIMVLAAFMASALSREQPVATPHGVVRVEKVRIEHKAELSQPPTPENLALLVALEGVSVLAGSPLVIHGSPSLVRDSDNAPGSGLEVGFHGWQAPSPD